MENEIKISNKPDNIKTDEIAMKSNDCISISYQVTRNNSGVLVNLYRDGL